MTIYLHYIKQEWEEFSKLNSALSIIIMGYLRMPRSAMQSRRRKTLKAMEDKNDTQQNLSNSHITSMSRWNS